jgi:hypothetical protein
VNVAPWGTPKEMNSHSNAKNSSIQNSHIAFHQG